MRQVCVVVTIMFGLLLSSSVALAQSAQTDSSAVPRVINVTGVFRPADGQPPAAVETVTLSIYADPEGGTPLWQETQPVTLDERGRYTVVLGAAHADGIPPAVLATGAQWLSTHFERTGEVEGPRVRLTSVPYALRAADADTLGGRPASDYLLATGTANEGGAASPQDSSVAAPAGELPGTPGAVAKYVDASNVGPSAITETGGMVGIGTTTPFDFLHVRYTNTGGNATGFAVQNLGNTATSYSGMLFYDQNGALGQFQGFNNLTHEYRINNVATAPTGSINFMIGSTSRFFIGSSGGVGIGTTSVGPGLSVSNALTGALVGSIGVSTFGNNSFGGTFVASKARGTQAAPAAVQNGDQIALFAGVGQASATNSGAFGNGMEIRAAENFTAATQGTAMNFLTTKRGTNTPAIRMTIDNVGNVGIGTTTPSATVEAVRDGDVAVVGATSFGDGCCAGFVARLARGTAAAPAAVQLGDPLALFQGDGYGATDFSSEAGGMVILAAENWTDTAQGTAVAFTTTPLGSTEDAGRMVVMPDGNVGIGTFNDFPVITDKLQVFGDIRVGTAGTNGCLRNFAGTGIAGTCASDRRFKKNIMSFGPVLDQLSQLQPVHYFWRASEFPEKHFGNSRAYGLIAQDVEQVLPELVDTDSDGFKAVDYSQLPLLTIQAVKELKSENDALKAENDAVKQRVAELDPLKQRVAELERLVAELVAASARR